MNDPAEWEAIHKSRMWGTYPDIHVVRQVKKFIAQWDDDNHRPEALDIGAGVGACSAMMGNEGMAVTAFDGAKTAIINMPHHRSVVPMVADAQTVEFPAESFDFILDNFTLTNIEEPPWERILSWLRPGGWMVCASFRFAPKGTPKTWRHSEVGDLVEIHESWVEGRSFSFDVRRYIKPS